jgi:hypothetical protein
MARVYPSLTQECQKILARKNGIVSSKYLKAMLESNKGEHITHLAQIIESAKILYKPETTC